MSEYIRISSYDKANQPGYRFINKVFESGI